jgi:tetratricopeptide (TPR) repeat protein
MNESQPRTHCTEPSAPLTPRLLIIFTCLLTYLLLATYSNHFYNSFHFDDSHVIETNSYIQSLKNIPLFFKDASTISSLPTNQQYRPMETVSLAIDYWLSQGLNPLWFHVSTFCWYVLQCLLMFVLFLKIANTVRVSRWNPFFSWVASLWYGVHTANAETINYVCARSDSLSTCWLVLSFVVFITLPKSRRFGLHLLPLMIATLFKQTAVVFPALLFLYVLYFEAHAGLDQLFNKHSCRKVLSHVLKSTGSSWITCFLMYLLVTRMDPATFSPGGTSVFHYLITQPFVIFHYFMTFFLPLQLSADTDQGLLTSLIDDRFFVGILFVISLLALAYTTSKKAETRPISFGIFWFFIALIPTSSIIPLAEVLNDHRIFFPFVGLVLAVSYAIYLTLLHHESAFYQKPWLKYLLITCLCGLIGAHAYGTYQRNKVWLTEESLWYDVSIKSPTNGRGLMNYGNTQMAKGNYLAAEQYFLKALQYTPYYGALHTNLGIVNVALGRPEQAETYFEKAIKFDNTSPGVLYYYAKYNLLKHPEAAEAALLKGIQLSPGNLGLRYLLMDVYIHQARWDLLNQMAHDTVTLVPHDADAREYSKLALEKTSPIHNTNNTPAAEKYLQSSVAYFNNKSFTDTIFQCEKAILLKPDFALAYNNICAAYIEMHQYPEASIACQKALEINPQFTLAQNNLRTTQLGQHRD